MQIRTVNKEIAKLGFKAELVKGNGYFYFVGDDIAEGEIDSVYVNSFNELTLARWIEEVKSAVEQSKQIRN